MTPDDFKQDEIIDVKLPRKDYQLLKKILEEREAKNWLTAKIASWWVFGLGAGALVLWQIWNELSSILNGTVK